MPAIEFSRLRTRIELLGKVYDQPGQFVKDLSDLYFFYSDLTFQSINPYIKSSAHRAWRNPVVINRELERLLKPKAKTHPQETINIIDTLWSTNTYEPCQLAAALLGALPIEYADPVLERILRWSQEGDDPELINVLHARGTETLRLERPEMWMEALKGWYQNRDQILQKLSVLGLLPMINDPEFNNLPIIFDFLESIITTPDSRLVITLLSIIEKLSKKSEAETVFFLKGIVTESKSPDLPRFIRRALPFFTENAQSSLKTCLRENQA